MAQVWKLSKINFVVFLDWSHDFTILFLLTWFWKYHFKEGKSIQMDPKTVIHYVITMKFPGKISSHYNDNYMLSIDIKCLIWTSFWTCRTTRSWTTKPVQEAFVPGWNLPAVEIMMTDNSAFVVYGWNSQIVAITCIKWAPPPLSS